MNSDIYVNDYPAVSPDGSFDPGSYLADTFVDELCHLLARVVVRLSAEHEQTPALQEEAA
mgnify:CR=1 FL=1